MRENKISKNEVKVSAKGELGYAGELWQKVSEHETSNMLLYDS